MTRREVVLTPQDVVLLDHLRRARTLREASYAAGMTRDRAVYRLRRLTRAAGRAVSNADRGGARHGGTRLAPEGERLLRLGAGASVGKAAGATESTGTYWEGIYQSGEVPIVEVLGGPRLAVAFAAEPGERVRVAVDPEAILLAGKRYPTSARNVLAGTVVVLRRRGPGTGGAQRIAEIRVGDRSVPVAVTDGAIRSLRLAAGRRVYLYVKATALRRADRPVRAVTRGSPRS